MTRPTEAARQAPFLLLIASGVILGALGVLADRVWPEFWMEEGRPLLQVAGYMLLVVIGNAAGFWTLSAVVVGLLTARRSHRFVMPVLVATAFLAVAVVSYYILHVLTGGRDATSQVGGATARWLVVVLIAGPLAGLVGAWLLSSDPLRKWLAWFGVGVLVTADAYLLWQGASDPYPVAALMALAIYAVVAVGSVLLLTRRRRIAM